MTGGTESAKATDKVSFALIGPDGKEKSIDSPSDPQLVTSERQKLEALFLAHLTMANYCRKKLDELPPEA